MSTEPQTLMEVIRQFADPDVCLDYMTAIRWPNGVACPACGSLEVRFISTRRMWECKSKHARKQFSIKIGTIFEDSPIALDKWLIAMWMLVNAKNGISSYELGKGIGVRQNTAWFMLQRIRLAMEDGIFNKMNGEVEVDETFIGGKARNMHKDKREATVKGRGGIGSGKAAVMGILERHGPDGHSRVRTQVVANTRRATLAPIIREHVESGSTIYSDALQSYVGLGDDYMHEAVNHDAQEYVRGNVHDNGMENFWSLLKRSLHGTYVSVEPFHLFRYLDEQVFRYNSRKITDSMRFRAVLHGIVGKRLTYEQLITSGNTPV